MYLLTQHPVQWGTRSAFPGCSVAGAWCGVLTSI